MVTAAKQLQLVFACILLLCLLVVCTVAEPMRSIVGAAVPNEGLKTNRVIMNNETTTTDSENPGPWCIAKPSTDLYSLQLNINECCKYPQVDCSVISPSGSCYEPDNLVSHAFVAMNLYYKAFGKNTWNCYFGGTGIIITHDPSVGRCVYPA